MVDLKMTVEVGVVVVFFVVTFIFIANLGWRKKVILFAIHIFSMILLLYGLNELNYLQYGYWINAALIIVPPVVIYFTYRMLKSRGKNQ